MSGTRPDEGDVLVMPNGTVSAYADPETGVVRLFCEPEPDEHDWQLGLEFAREHGNGQPPDEYMDQGVVVFEFQVDPKP